MADDAVVAPTPGSLTKLASMFDDFSTSADWVVLALTDLKLSPASVRWGAELRDRFNDRKSTYQTKIDNLRQDFRDIADQLRKIEASYQDTEIDNKDDIDRLSDLVSALAIRNPNVTSVMPTPSL